MPKQRFQKTILRQTDGRSPQWYIRPWIDMIGPDRRAMRVKRRYYVGAVATTKKRDAEKQANAIMATINRAAYVIQSQVKFGDFLDAFLRNHVRRPDGMASSTQAKYETHIENHIRPAFGDLMLCQVDAPCIQAWLNDKAKLRVVDGVKKVGLSWNTRLDLRNILSSIFTKAAHWNYFQDRNPAEMVDLGRKRLVRERRKTSEEETRRLLAALSAEVRDICLMALFFTLRISEVLGLQEKHFDFSTGQILIRQRWYRGDLDVVKSEKSRRDIDMGLMADSLKRKMTGDPNRFVFSVSTRPKWGKACPRVCRDDRDINQHFLRPAAKALGIYYPGFGFHALRHEGVTEYSADPMQAQKIAGHSRPAMTAHYTLADRQRQASLIRNFQSRILGDEIGGVQ